MSAIVKIVTSRLSKEPASNNLDQQDGDGGEDLANASDIEFDPASEIGRHEAKYDTNEGSESTRDNADRRSLPHPYCHRREKVATKEVGSERITPTGRTLCRGGERVGMLRIDGKEADRRKGDQNEKDGHADTQTLVSA